jgi:hypothetical protein
MTSTAENYQTQLKLADSTLLKTDAYINGEWCGAADNARFDVTGGDCSGRCGLGSLAREDRQGAGRHIAQAVLPDDG